MQLVISRQLGLQLQLGAEAGHLCIGLVRARLHLRERVGGWTPDHVDKFSEDLAVEDGRVLKHLRHVGVYSAVLSASS